MAGLVDDLYEELLAYLEPLLDAIRERDAFEELLHRHGYNVALAGEVHAAIAGEGALPAAIERVDDSYAALRAAQASGGSIETELVAFATATGELLLLLEALALPDLADLPPPLASPSDVTAFGRAVLDTLTTDYLRRRRPKLHALLFAAGVIVHESVAAAAPFRRAHRREVIDWSAFSRLLSEPAGHLAARYAWNRPDEPFRIEALVEAVGRLANAFGVRTITDHDPARLHAERIDAAPIVPTPELDALRALPIDTQDLSDGSFVVAGADLFALSTEAGAAPAGFAIMPLLTGGTERDIPLGRTVTLRLEAAGAPFAGSPVLVLPNASRWQVAEGDARIGATLRVEPDATVTLLGTPGSAQLSLRGAEMALTLAKRGGEPHAEAALALGKGDTSNGLRLHVPLGDADGFLRSVVARDSIDVTSQATLRWSSDGGFELAAGGVLAVPLAPHVDLGPVDLLDTRIELRARADETGGGLAARIRSDLRTTIGPVAVTLAGLGVEAAAGPAGSGTPDFRLGDTALNLRFRPPDGAALAVRSTLISGGGFVLRDPERHAYAGQLLLDAGGISLSAFGDLATRDAAGGELPDPGFSLVIVMGARFAPIQLGLGFNLSGIGGLIALHRRTDFDLLRAGLTSGALDAVLFPETPAQSPGRTVGALAALFPIAPGRHLLGPLLRLGWGTPTLVDIDLGVLFPIGGPARIYLLGRVRAAFPRADSAALVLDLGVAGDIDPAAGLLRLDGTLRHSSIAGADLSGDMAARLRWRGEEAFILAFGGFHPDFRAELDVPALKPLQVTVSRGTGLRIDAEAYLAITSNTLQFGGHAELVVRKSAFGVDGFFDFHALFVLSPFSFVAGLDFEVHLRFKGRSFASVGLAFTLSGPRPWRAEGRVKIKIVFVTFKLPFNFAWGSETPALEPPRAVWPELEAALGDPASWRAVPPPEHRRDVIVLPRAEPGLVTVHPHGRLELRQEVVPFGIELERFGAASVSGDNRFARPRLASGTTELPATPIESAFAAGQFLELARDEALSRPSFERMEAGVRIGSDALRDGGGRREVELVHETALLQPAGVRRPPFDPGTIYRPPLDGALQRMSGAARTRETTEAGNPFRRAGARPAVTLRAERYTLAETLTGTTGGATVGSFTAADQARRRLLRRTPEADLAVVSTGELR